MITVAIGKMHEMDSGKYTHTADVVMWTGNTHHNIGSLRKRYSDGKYDFVAGGTLLSEAKDWSLGFDTVDAARRWLETTLNARELLASAYSRDLVAARS